MLSTAKIPLIDIAAGGAEVKEVARVLVDAATTFGFVYIRNNGGLIPPDQLRDAWDISRALFASPVEEKSRCTIKSDNKGWTGMHAETLDPKVQKTGDFKECFNFGEFVDGRADQPIPSSIAPYETKIAAFRESCHGLCRRLLLLFGIGLEVDPPEFFAERHAADKGPSGTTLRMLYYPPPSAVGTAWADDFRAGAHSDYGSMTLLFRLAGQAGLEILTPEARWAAVPVCPPGTEGDAAPPILINIGDLMSYWTNGLLRSTLHRVVFPGDGGGLPGESTADPRYSIAFFCHPSRETVLAPVPSERVRVFAGGTEQERAAVAAANPYTERTAMTATEHLKMRLRDTYLAGAFAEAEVSS